MEVSGKQWKYLNEGNVHIVIQILNTDYVLRLVKEHGSVVNFKAIQDSIKFVNSVMIPFLCDSSQYREEVIEISMESLAYLSEKLLEIRPPRRKIKLNLSKFAIKAPNLTIISPNNVNYCLEIKPKEGFKSACFNTLPKCYFCLKQYLKLQEKDISKISTYCPLNLFSGDRKRMKAALLSLVHNPQNNFKIFKDGKIIYNEKSDIFEFHELVNNMAIFSSTNLFLDFVIDMLLNDGQSSTITNESEAISSVPKTEKCVGTNNLVSGTFLYKLLTLQKLSENLVQNINNEDGSFEYVPSILSELELQHLQLSIEKDRKIFFDSISPTHLTLISAVAKDCSIMISFSPGTVGTLPHIQVGEIKLSYRTSVTDLEPKPASTLLKRKHTEKKLITTYQKYVNSTDSTSSKYSGIQPHLETRGKQLEAWQQLIAIYMKANKQSTIDIRESQNSPLFNNASINRKLSQESILTILENMAKTGRAAPIDKSKNVWEIYWHSLDEWGNMVYSWACSNGLNNSVCTLFELIEGENTEGEEFHGLDVNILIKALKSLEVKGKCELIQFDDNQGVKFF